MEADVIVSWSFASVPEAVKSAFQRPTQFVVLPTPASRGYGQQVQELGQNPVRAAIKKYLPGLTPLRVAVLGFSESCHGVRNLLNSGDGANIDACVAIDGIHTPYVNKKVDPNTMLPWLGIGSLAVVNARLFVATHSSIVPPGYASTTETAKYLWETLTGGSEAFTAPPVPDLSAPPTTIHIAGGPGTGKMRDISYPAPAWQTPLRAGGLVVLGCNNVDKPGTADHIYQAKVILPLVLRRFLAERWNNIDPKALGGSCFISGAQTQTSETPFHWLGLGSAQSVPPNKCAESMVLPADYIETGASNPLPNVTAVPASAGAASGKSSLVAAVGLVAAGTLGLWWMSSKQAAGALRSNPKKRSRPRITLVPLSEGRMAGEVDEEVFIFSASKSAEEWIRYCSAHPEADCAFWAGEFGGAPLNEGLVR